MADPKVKTVLAKAENFLKRNLILTNTTIEKLKKAGIITDVAYGKMLRETSVEQVVTLLYVLRHRSMDVLMKFLQVLQQSMDGWIVNTILDTPINESSVTNTLLKSKTLREYLNNDLYNEGDELDHSMQDIFLKDERTKLEADIGETSVSRQHAFYNGRGYRRQLLPEQLHEVHSQFLQRKEENEKSMTVLRQEERMIKDLLYQNYREQAQINEHQRTLDALDRRMYQVRSEAGQLLLQPSPSRDVANRRLQKLDSIRWHKSKSH